MKYFFDTEFIEGFHKPMFGKARHFIDLISIGIVAEDGRTYYAISSEYDYKKADDWVKENVIRPLFLSQPAEITQVFDEEGFHKIIGKKNADIAKEIYDFVNPDLAFHVSAYNNSEFRDPNSYVSKLFAAHNVISIGEHFVAQPEFWAYYADYDWVVFCSLFGSMMNLPKGFPMYCRDLKQLLDYKLETGALYAKRKAFEPQEGGSPTRTLKEKLDMVKAHPDYPTNKDAHNALADALWNKGLHEFIKQKL